MKDKKKDLMIGRQYGKYEVLSYYPDKKPGKYYECMCTCGYIMIKAGTELRAGRATQCQACMYLTLYDPLKVIDRYYGSWKVIDFVGYHNGSRQYEFECRCGYRKLNCLSDMGHKKSTQCFVCHNREVAQKNIKHGMHATLIYKIWSSMKARCENPHSNSYHWYGARGIQVCDRWHKFENFYEDMGDRPKGLTLDRIDNDGNYCKENCRWITHKENCQNRQKRKQG